MSKQKKWYIPHELVIAAANQVGDFLSVGGNYCCADKWGEMEKSLCRSFLPQEYHHIETDLIGQQVITLRKAGKLNGDKKRARKKYSEPTGEYAKYLLSDHWKGFSRKIREFWDNSCCLCMSNKKTEVHHRTYSRIGSERLTDCVLLCHTCHRKVHGSMADGNLFMGETHQ